MVKFAEFQARIKGFYRFSRQEAAGLLAAVLVTAFIFSFRDWGAEQFSLLTGLGNFLTVLLIAALSFWFRISCQKLYGLAEGYKAEFKVWWMGLGIALVIAFISLGRVPLILAGAMSVAFMVKQRLGEFRYGFSNWHNGMIAYWGVLGNLILAGLFAIGLFALPESYFFGKGLLLNLIMAFASLLPLPQLDGLSIFFASRKLYILAWVVAVFVALLLITQSKAGLIVAIVFGLVYGLIYILIGSEK